MISTILNLLNIVGFNLNQEYDNWPIAKENIPGFTSPERMLRLVRQKQFFRSRPSIMNFIKILSNLAGKQEPQITLNYGHNMLQENTKIDLANMETLLTDVFKTLSNDTNANVTQPQEDPEKKRKVHV